MFHALVLVCFMHCLFQPSSAARILGVVSTPSYSHQVAFRPLWRELSLRGHHLTVLTTDPMHDSVLTNLTEIDLHFSYELWNKNILDIVSEDTFMKTFNVILPTVEAITEQQLQHPPVRALIRNETEHFDLVIAELIPAMSAFSVRFKCPFIGMLSTDAPSMIYEVLGNPTHPVAYPDSILPFSGRLNFWERLQSVASSLLMKLYAEMYGYRWQQSLVQTHFGDDYPSLYDIFVNMSMLFVNTDLILHQVRALVPTIIQIGGGSHRQPPKPLPNDLQMFLDNAKQGFIYFSLGTNVKSKDLPEPVQRIILEAFSELPYLVLWKFELEAKDLPIQPKNVIVSKWYPQQDIFKHPNIKLFITQGGQQSIEEAIYDHIPMVGMPFCGDQPSNVKRLVAKGLGRSVYHKTMDKDIFKNAVLEVVNNPKYKHNIKELATLAKDQPMTGLERAVWWTAYVLRHAGTKHLRSPAVNLPAYQYFLLDVIGFCLLTLVIVAYLLIILTRSSLKILYYINTQLKVKAD